MYLCARHSWTSRRQVNLRLVFGHVPRPIRHSPDRVDIYDCWGGRRPNPPPPPAKVSTPSVACMEEPALMSAMGGEVVTPSTTPRVGVAAPASSTSASPTTCDSGDLVREGDDGATDTSCGPAADLHRANYTSTSYPNKKHKDRISSYVHTLAQPEAEDSAKTPEA
jgi:hypothetical protein